MNYGTDLQTVDQCIEDLKQNYTKPGHPIAFSGINSIYKYYKGILTIKNIKEVLSSIENYTLHREYHSEQRNPSYSHFKRYQFQADLIDIQKLSKYNDGINYLLTCIDTFTRFAYVRPLISKHAENVVNAFVSIFEESLTLPQILTMDRGSEFTNNYFKEFCQLNNINCRMADSSSHASFVERFNLTLQRLMYKHMSEFETKRYIDRTEKNGNVIPVLSELVKTYNNRIHSSIGVTPFEAENNPNVHLGMRLKMSKYYESVKRKPVKFNIGDKVRIAKLKGKFSRGYEESSNEEVFKIYDIKRKTRIPMYILSDFNETEIIKGSFYSFELTKVTGDVYRVEKVLKTRQRNGKTEHYVKWRGYNDSHNSWIEDKDIVQNFNNE